MSSINDPNKNEKFPVLTFLMLAAFYIIGLLLLDLSRFNSPSDYLMDTYMITFPDTANLWTLKSVFEWQWQIFSYYLVHFALVHYGYSGLLMLYYVQGLERATNKKTVLISFFATGILAPIILGPMIYLTWQYFEPAKQFFFIQSYYMGSSVGIWGCMGFSAPFNRKRRFFWIGIALMLFPEFILKVIAGTGDIIANVVHVCVFLINWFIATRVYSERSTDGKEGALHLTDNKHLILIILAAIHSIILIIYFIDILGFFDENILSYLF